MPIYKIQQAVNKYNLKKKRIGTQILTIATKNMKC